MKENNVVIGIEGLVGSGKTSICRELIKTIPNTVLLNGGNLYRAIVYVLLQKEPNILKLKKIMKKADIKKFMDDFNVNIRIEDNESKIYIGEELASEELLQSRTSSLAVSIIGGIADNTKLFEYARDLINQLKEDHIIIVSGRSLMKIYPELDYHIFVTASLEERIKRKCIQYKEKNDIKDVKNNVVKRDRLQKIAGFYKIYPNTIKIDVTECKSVEESTKKVLELINY